MTTAAATAIQPAATPSAGGRLVALDGRALPLTAARLTAHAAGGLCRTVLEQRFHNPHAEPLRVTYQFPLPHDGAVSGFAFRLGDRRVVGEVDRLQAARERFERALVEGRTAGLVEQVRGSVFTQELGNVPPGAEVVAELTVDQRLAWLPEGAWEWRFPTAVAPRYQGGPGRTPDGGRLQVGVAEHGLPVRLTLSLEVADALAEGGALTSPTHALRVDGGPVPRATLAAAGGVPLDRDVAIRWPVAAPSVGAALSAARVDGGRLAGRAFGLVTLVPPAPRAVRAVPRDLVVLLDTSGSMSGAPLDQARALVSSLVDSLRDEDRLELIEFSDEPRRWRPGATQATPQARRGALDWLARLRASGSTEMGLALIEALRPLRAEAQRQVVLVTDGQIGFEHEVLETVLRRLPRGARLHTVAVGSAANRSLTGPAARAGRGVEVVVGLDEPAEAAAARLLARTVAPVVTDLELSGPALRRAPAHAPDLFAGAPALLPVELQPQGGALEVRGRSADGDWVQVIAVPPPAAGGLAGALAALDGRERVEALEADRAIAERPGAVDLVIEQLGLDFQISTRRTSWVAVSDEATVDPRQPTRRERVPQALPHGMSVAGLGLRAAAAPASLDLAFAASACVSDELEEAGGLELAKAAPPPPAPAAFSQRMGAPAEPDEERAAPKKEVRKAPRRRGRQARTLAARVVLRSGREVVLELEVPRGGLDWAPGDSAEVDTSAGPCAAAVMADGTTADGALRAGVALRIVLRLEAELPGARLLRVTLADGLLLELAASP